MCSHEMKMESADSLTQVHVEYPCSMGMVTLFDDLDGIVAGGHQQADTMLETEIWGVSMGSRPPGILSLDVFISTFPFPTASFHSYPSYFQLCSCLPVSLLHLFPLFSLQHYAHTCARARVCVGGGGREEGMEV
jgi:hypothetical protein